MNHFVLYVDDLKRSTDFYGRILAWRQAAPDVPGCRAVAFSSRRAHRDLLLIEVGTHAAPIPPARRPGLRRSGTGVVDTDDELRAAVPSSWLRPGL